MPYSPTTWANQVTALNAAHMNNIESGIVGAYAQTLDSIATANPVSGNVSMNSHGFTNLASASAATSLTFNSGAGAVSGDTIIQTNGSEAARFLFGAAGPPDTRGTLLFNHGDYVLGAKPQYNVQTGRYLDIRQGTTASPDAGLVPPIKVSRTIDLLHTATGFVGDGAEQMAAISGNVAASSSGTQNDVQAVGGYFSATNSSTATGGGANSPDACGVYSVGVINTGGHGVAIGGCFIAQRKTTAAFAATTQQVFVFNDTSTHSTYSASAVSDTGILLISQGAKNAAVGIAIENQGSKFDVGIGFMSNGTGGSVLTTSISDDSSSVTSYAINGSHFYGIDTSGATIASGGSTTATGSNALDSATVNVGSTTGFATAGTFFLVGVPVSYTGVTATSFTGCGTHAATTGGEGISPPRYAILLGNNTSVGAKKADGTIGNLLRVATAGGNILLGSSSLGSIVIPNNKGIIGFDTTNNSGYNLAIVGTGNTVTFGDTGTSTTINGTAITLNAATTAAGNIALGSHKVTGSAAATTAGDLVRYEQTVGAGLQAPLLGQLKDVQVFSANGTWTKPGSGTIALIFIRGAGGGGGGGSAGVSGTSRSGGAGGGSAGYVHFAIPLAALGSTATVTVGTGGAGGSAGNAGSNGSATTQFDTATGNCATPASVTVGGGGGAGGTGTSTAGTAGTATVPAYTAGATKYSSAAVSSNGAAGATCAAGAVGSNGTAPGSGGAGGGFNSTGPTFKAGGSGDFTASTVTAVGQPGLSDSYAGQPPLAPTLAPGGPGFVGGGGGGAGSVAVGGGKGADGLGGGGGGGGGSCITGNGTAGTGGNGGDGCVVVLVY